MKVARPHCGIEEDGAILRNLAALRSFRFPDDPELERHRKIVCAADLLRILEVLVLAGGGHASGEEEGSAQEGAEY